jgi:branched-chain amino acid transport system substrate-binding protein
MQVVEQAIVGTGSLDEAKLAQFTRDGSFKTILGDVKFGVGGGWSEARVLQAQYRRINGNDLSNFKDANSSGGVARAFIASDTLIYPYEQAKQSI